MDTELAKKLLFLIDSTSEWPLDTTSCPSLVSYKAEKLQQTVEFLRSQDQIVAARRQDERTVLTDKGKSLLARGTPFKHWADVFQMKENETLTKRRLQVRTNFVVLPCSTLPLTETDADGQECRLRRRFRTLIEASD
jgi:hypothetical protein